jgi:hypothetical protein
MKNTMIALIALFSMNAFAELPPSRLYNSKDSFKRYRHDKRIRDEFRKIEKDKQAEAELEKAKVKAVYSEYYVKRLEAEIYKFKTILEVERERVKNLKAENAKLKSTLKKERDDSKNTLTKIVIVVESDSTIKKGK